MSAHNKSFPSNVLIVFKKCQELMSGLLWIGSEGKESNHEAYEAASEEGGVMEC